MAQAFWWFEGEAVEELTRRIVAAGSRNVRLQVHPDGDKLTFLVMPRGVVTLGHEEGHEDPVNDSHRCPPDCP